MNFNKAAKNWDTEKRINRAQILAHSILNKFDNTKDMKALEIGCGTGLVTLNLNNSFKEIYCIDTSEEMIKILKTKLQEKNINNIHPASKDIVSTNKFDLIYSSMVFHHIENIHDELVMIHEHLDDNGYLIIIDLDEDDGSFHKDEVNFHGHNGFNRTKLKDLLESCNYKDISFETVFEGKKDLKDKTIDYSLFLCLAKI